MRIVAILFGVMAAAAAIPSGEDVDNSTFSSLVEDFLRGFFFVACLTFIVGPLTSVSVGDLGVIVVWSWVYVCSCWRRWPLSPLVALAEPETEAVAGIETGLAVEVEVVAVTEAGESARGFNDGGVDRDKTLLPELVEFSRL